MIILQDILVDLTAFASRSVSIPGHEDFYTHHGVLLTAEYLVGQLVGKTGLEQGLCSEYDVRRGKPLLDIAWNKLNDIIGEDGAKVSCDTYIYILYWE